MTTKNVRRINEHCESNNCESLVWCMFCLSSHTGSWIGFIFQMKSNFHTSICVLFSDKAQNRKKGWNECII